MRTHPRARGASVDVVVVLLMTACIVGAALLVTLVVYLRSLGVPHGVYYLGYDLGGLSREEAVDVVERSTVTVLSKPIYLKWGHQMRVLRYPEHFRLDVAAKEVVGEGIAGIRQRRTWKDELRYHFQLDYPRVDLPVRVRLDRDFCHKQMATLFDGIVAEKILARRLDRERVELWRPDGGIRFAEILSTIEASMRTQPLLDRREIVLRPPGEEGAREVVRIDDPACGFTVGLAWLELRISGLGPGGYSALRRAVDKVDGVLLNPGEAFSLSSRVGSAVLSSEDARAGLAYLASGLYRASLAAGAVILERHAHPRFTSALASCAPPGLDARLDPDRDLRMRFRHTAPMLVRIRLRAHSISFEVCSTRALQEHIEITSGSITRLPYETEWVEDPSLRAGAESIERPGVDGLQVRTYRTRRDRKGGRVLAVETISEDSYETSPARVRIRGLPQ